MNKKGTHILQRAICKAFFGRGAFDIFLFMERNKQAAVLRQFPRQTKGLDIFIKNIKKQARSPNILHQLPACFLFDLEGYFFN